jgi:hypothetical protein
MTKVERVYDCGWGYEVGGGRWEAEVLLRNGSRRSRSPVVAKEASRRLFARPTHAPAGGEGSRGHSRLSLDFRC